MSPFQFQECILCSLLNAIQSHPKCLRILRESFRFVLRTKPLGHLLFPFLPFLACCGRSLVLAVVQCGSRPHINVAATVLYTLFLLLELAQRSPDKQPLTEGDSWLSHSRNVLGKKS